MDFRRYDTNSTRPLSSITLDPSSSFVPNRKSHTRPSSSGSGSHCRLSRRPRSSIDLFRSRMEERRFSAPPDSTTPPPRRPRSSSRARPTSFLDMSEPSRFSLSGVKLLSSTSMEGIKAGKRKVSLEVKIPDGMSSTESFGHINMARTGSTTVGRTLNSLFLRAKRASQESGPSSPPDLFSGESAHSDSSLPPTPRTGTFPPNDLSGTGLVENERKTELTEEEKERREIMRIRSQFDYRRQGIPHHKFPKHEVPYMQSYSHVSLHNDYYTTDLLQHLTPNNSPTFHDFGNNPPLNVLDLGGGEGYWAAEAATFWKAAGTTVTVYDIVDLGRPVKKAIDPELYHRVIFQQGNFLKSVSQIPPKSFDLVRMANLTLAIPKARWPHLLKEVKRILRPGGVVEIIDDELFFPSIQPGPAPTLKHCKSMAGRRKPKPDLVDRSADDTALKPTQPLPPSYTKDGSPRGCRESLNDANDPAGEYRQRSITTRTMETIFQNMLQYEYGLSLQPHEFLEHEMLKVFDGVTVETKEVSVPKRDLSMKSGDIGTYPSDSTKLRKSRNSLEDAVLTDFSRPAFVAPKAAKLLQLDAGNAGPAPYQPSGYIISPDTFVPCEPDVLEMHALRNVHILLSCKIALRRWFDRHRDEHGEPELTEDEFEELISDYEDFKRRRMNWPRYYPCVDFEEEPQSPTLSPKPLFGRRETVPRNRDSSIETTTIVSVPKDALIPVRRFRVYVGHKSDPRAMHTR